VRKTFFQAMSVILVFGLLSACTEEKKPDGPWKPLDDNEQAAIKIMYWDSRPFYFEYGNSFRDNFPNIEIDVANMQKIFDDESLTYEEGFEKFLKEQKPDVLLLREHQYERLAREGKLLALDPVIQQDQFELEGIHPAVIKLLRERGGGTLYGLSPDFTSRGLYYNIDLFKEKGVEPPGDSMSWDEVFELAKRFPTDGDNESRVFGLTLDDYYGISDLIQAIGTEQDLRMLNADGTEFIVSTDSWRKVFQSTIDAAKSGALYVPTNEDLNVNYDSLRAKFENNRFLMGKSAMAFKSGNEVQEIVTAKDYLKNDKLINWGLVTAPSGSDSRNQSSYYSLVGIFAVSSSSENPRAAWEFIKHINSDDFAKQKSKSGNALLLSRTEHIRDKDGRSLEPLYKLEPKANWNFESQKAPSSFFTSLSELINEEFAAVLKDEKNVEEALSSLQEKGQAELTKARSAG